MKRKKSFKFIIIITVLVVLVAWDIKQADSQLFNLYKTYHIVNKIDAVSSATTKVSIVRSDDEDLDNPTAITNADISYQTIEDMTRRAIELAGGIDWLISSGDMVLLKPNIVSPTKPQSGEVTDVRVIKALIKIIDEISPGNIEIVVGEGCAVPMDYEYEYNEFYREGQWGKLWDKSGYQDLLTDELLNGINFRLSNLNCHMPGSDWREGDGWPKDSAWADLIEVSIPGGGEATPHEGKYWIHKDVINADVYITVPVMKIHTTGITSSLKNQVGIAPSTKYGFYKALGVPQNNYSEKIMHYAEKPYWWTAKEIVDLSNLAGIDFSVVDATACLESQKEAVGNNLVRMNMILAGTDPVAVDHVCTRLMGLNPDDVEHITLAERAGLGTNDPDLIMMEGADLESNIRKFKKSHQEDGEFGQGNRLWVLKGSYDINGIDDPINHDFIEDEGSVSPKAGEDGWSESLYFTDNRIHLGDYYKLNSGDKVVSYAFCYFDAPKDQEAELWIGNDEDILIYVNGEIIYSHTGYQNYDEFDLTIDKASFSIKKGENRMLVKYLQEYSYYDFCLNICEPESNRLLDGNRIWGLKFRTESSSPSSIKGKQGFDVKKAYPNPFTISTTIEYSVSIEEHVEVSIYNLQGQKINTLFAGKQVAGNHKLIWNGIGLNGHRVPIGIYFASISVDGNVNTQKLILTSNN